ncbi:GDP-L-fucose synthase [Campylobacter upsaliensis]|nr:GDP-L-fucose synthase [Campylobacter upsaliensis]EKA2509846.1 GDP-L-fucose synthase [Campylobacter upsaliensis]EKM3878803.1 GDP-L-fucose synthase [Campylobacter upsaliensis]
MLKDSLIYVAGHRGLTGSAIVQNLKSKGYTNLLYKSHAELDLTNQEAVAEFFASQKPEFVFLAAARVGSIMANATYRAEFIYENLMIQNNVIHQAYLNGVKKLLFLGTTCIYPKKAPQPLKEEYLLTSELEFTNEPYAIAKIAGLKMCEAYNLQYGTNFISVMPTGIYGHNDNFHLENCHVLPALMRKIHLAKLLKEKNSPALLKDIGAKDMSEAREFLERFGIDENGIRLWGSGVARREFLHSSDMADACVFVMENVNFKDLCGDGEVKNTHINIGYGEDFSIKELALMMFKILGFDGKLYFDTSKPDGTLRKLPDCSKLNALGWKYKITLEEGIKLMYAWYLKNDVKRK